MDEVSEWILRSLAAHGEARSTLELETSREREGLPAVPLQSLLEGLADAGYIWKGHFGAGSYLNQPDVHNADFWRIENQGRKYVNEH